MHFINLRNYILILLTGFLYACTVYTGTEILFPAPSSPNYASTWGSEYKKLSEKEKEKRKKEDAKKRDEYVNKAKEKRKKRFLLALVVNIIMLTALFLFPSFSLIQSGLLIGFLISIVFTYSSYWENLSEIAQFLSLLTALVILLFGTYRTLIQKKKGN